MRLAGRATLVLLVFAVVGYGTMHWITARAVAHGTPEYQVRMGGALGGLFAGGAAATLVALALLLGGGKRSAASESSSGEKSTTE